MKKTTKKNVFGHYPHELKPELGRISIIHMNWRWDHTDQIETLISNNYPQHELKAGYSQHELNAGIQNIQIRYPAIIWNVMVVTPRQAIWQCDKTGYKKIVWLLTCLEKNIIKICVSVKPAYGKYYISHQISGVHKGVHTKRGVHK